MSRLRKLGYSKDEISLSGFSATASTLLNEMGRWNPDAIERQLAHMKENTFAASNLATFDSLTRRQSCSEQ